MATYFVDFKNGSDSSGTGATGNPWKTPAKALTVVTSGDTVKFRGSKTDSTTYYRAAWNASVAGVTWTNDTGHTPTWHGGFHTGENDYGLTGTVPGSAYASMIKITAHNVTLSGLRVQHVGGEGFGVDFLGNSEDVGVENATITNCESDVTYGAAMVVTGKRKNNGDIVGPIAPEISYCTFTRMGAGKFDPDKESGKRGKDAVQGSIQLLHCYDAHFHHNLCAYGWGEGINVGRGSTRSIVEYNVVHTMDHIHIAMVRCSDCDVRYNVVYHTKHPDFLGGKGGATDIPPSFRIGDEMGDKMLLYSHSVKQRLYGNLAIGGSYCFTVQNGGNFQTRLDRAYIGYNTFIGELSHPTLGTPPTDYVFKIDAHGGDGAHINSLVENNICYAPRGVPMVKAEGVGGVTFRNNAWYSVDGTAAPPPARSGTDITADPRIADPLRALIDAYPNPATAATGFSFNNYRLLADSPVIGRASGRGATNGVTPPTITQDLTGAARTDYDINNARYYDIGAIEYNGVVADSVTASFSGAPRSGNAPLSVAFTDESTATGNASINSRSWTFGDGDTSTQRNPNHSYAAAGTYSVTLTVQDTTRGLSNSLTRTDYITVGSPPTSTVTANFTATPRNGVAPLTVAFTDTSITSGSASINSRAWTFGDGGTETRRNPTHIYTAAGTYDVGLTVQDTALGLSDGETKNDYITVTDTSTVTADFTQSATGGESPLVVTFTDTSTVEGAAVIDRRVWEFGDGVIAENVASVPYIYSVAGQYTPSLTVYDTERNLISRKTGETITITAPPPDDEPGVIDVVRMLLPGQVGTRTVPFNLRGRAPALVLLFFTRAAVIDTPHDDGFISIGAVTATEQWAASFVSNDAAAPSSTKRYFTTTGCIAAVDGTELDGLAARGTLGPDSLTLNITDAFTGGYLHAIAFAGSQWRARAAEVWLGDTNSITPLNPGFVPEWYFFSGISRLLGTIEDNADFIIGMSDGTTKIGQTWREVNGQATTRLRSVITTNSIFMHPAGSSAAYLNHEAVGTLAPASSISVSGDFNTRHGWAALDIAGSTQVQTVMLESPVTTGVTSYALDFEPVAALMTLSNHYQASSPTPGGDSTEALAIVLADAGATYSICLAADDGAAATNSRTQVSDGIKLIGPDGTVILAGTLAFTADGIDINWTTVQNVRRYFNVTVWSGTPSIVGPVPQFEADDTTPPDGVVHFRDLSNPNGSPITSWGWQFGDGGESTEQHPEHSYMTPGTYHVTLTVSNANGSETLFKPNFVHYLASEHWLLGPYESRAVTRASVDRLYGDDPTASTYGYHEHALELDGLELDAQPDTDVTDGPVRPGKALIKLDWNGKKIVIVWPDGTTSEFSED